MNLTFEQYSKRYPEKIEFITYLQKQASLSLENLLYFRAHNLKSMFYTKMYNIKNLPEWRACYILPKYRVLHSIKLLGLYLRATNLHHKKLLITVPNILIPYFELNEELQEINDIKLRSYREFLFNWHVRVGSISLLHLTITTILFLSSSKLLHISV